MFPSFSSTFRRASGLLILGLPALSLPAQVITGANGLELTEFAREPMVRNAVAVTVDENEHVFVTSVVRRQAADLDIRRFKEWIEKELSLTSVAAKKAWFERELTPANSARYADRFEDQNHDGIFDFSDLSLLADQISRLTDTDGDGRANNVVKFNAAENSSVTGIAAGLASWDGSLYATVEPDLLRLDAPDSDGIPDQRTVLASGFSLHIGYGGHNFSGALIGPDGRLYASVADRGMNVTDQDGENHYNPHSGAIVRSELDGSNFEIFATGLRNVQEPAFNAYGDLIGVDNDGDFPDEKERLVHITEGSDTGWRTNWQYRGDDWLPWMDERMAFPDHAEQPSYLTPPLQLYKDGPAGFAFNPGTALNPFYRDHFFMTAFPSRNLYAFKLGPAGPSYHMVGEHTVAQGVLMTGVSFGPSGALYIADWSSEGYAMNEKGAVWKLDDPTKTSSELRRHTAQLIAMDWAEATVGELRTHLAHPDQRVRMKAQFALVRRNQSETLFAVAGDAQNDQLGRLHAIWGLGQLRRHGHPLPAANLLALLNDDDARVRAQTVKILGEGPALPPTVLAAMRNLLADSADRPRFFAAIALGRQQDTAAAPALIAYLERNATDRFHRHAGVMGLVGTTSPPNLAALAQHPDRLVRLAAIVALRRLRSPEVTVFLNDADPLVVAEAAGAIHDDESIPAALPALAALLDHPDGLHERTIRRAMSAALRARGPGQAGRLAAFAQDAQQDRELRVQALNLLAQWPAPQKLDSVEGRYRPLEEIDPSSLRDSLTPALAALSQSADFAIANAAWNAAAIYGIQPSLAELLTIVQQDTPIAAAAMGTLAQGESAERIRATELALKSRHSSVRIAALRSLREISHPQFLDAIERFLTRPELVEPRAALSLITGSSDPGERRILLAQIGRLRRGELNPAIALDVITAAANSAAPAISTALAAYENAKDATDPLSPYRETLHGGDPVRGKSVFNTSVTAQCTLCHRLGWQGSNVGPPLTHIGQKTPEYLLESLVNPGAVVAPGFGMTTVTLKSGETVSGALMNESATAIEVAPAGGETRSIALADIASRTPPMSSMPPMGALMSRTELRDLLAFLQSLK